MRDFPGVLLQCSASMSLVTLVYAAVLPLLSKRYDAAWRYMGWLVIAAGWIFPVRPGICLPVHMTDIPAWPVKQFIAAIPSIPGTGGSVKAPETVWPVVIWIAGVLIILVYHALRHVRFMNLVRRWSEPAAGAERKILDELTAEMGIKERIGLTVCRSVTSPMLVGFFRPVILLPPFNLAPDELSLVLKHELIHVQRHDLWYKALILAATALHWFNPAVYLMAQAAAVQCEVSCDALVLRGADLKRRRRYGETIMAIVRNGAKFRTALSTNFYGGKRGMKNRISSIMDTKRKRAGVVILCLALAGIVAAGAVFADTTDEGVEIAVAVALDDNGTKQMSVDGGQTWMTWEEYQQQYPTLDVVWWTYDDYSEWLEQEKINLRLLALVHPGWSQERVGTAIQGYERILEDIGNGMRYSRSIDGYDELALGFTIGPVSNSTGVSFGDSVIDLGSYATKEERFAAVAAFCDEQVKAGNMTQREADMILNEF